MSTATTNYIPAPQSVELHLSTSPEFSRYSKKVKALGGRYSHCRGDVSRRFVTLPWTEEGRELANTLVAQFGTGSVICGKTTLIVRTCNRSFRGRHIHAWVIVHKIDRASSDPCGSLLAKYEAAFSRAFPGAVEPEPEPAPSQPDPDAEKNVTLTVSLNEARTILAALSRRVSDLESLGGPQSAGLAEEARAAYQSIDQQTFHPCS